MPSKLIAADKAAAAQPLRWARTTAPADAVRHAGAAPNHSSAQDGGPEPDHVRVLITQQQRIQELVDGGGRLGSALRRPSSFAKQATICRSMLNQKRIP